MSILVQSARPERPRFRRAVDNLLQAVVIGLASGLACMLIRLVLMGLQWLATQHAGFLPEAATQLSWPRRMLTPALGAFAATVLLWIAHRYSRNAEFIDYIEAVRFRKCDIPFLPTLWRTLSSAFSVATGAAVGREGSMIQFAAATTSWLGQRMPRPLPTTRQIALGVAAAVAAVYKAPVAGIFFAVEIVLDDWTWRDLPPIAIAAAIGSLVSSFAFGSDAPVLQTHRFPLTAEWLWALPLALGLGAVGPTYQRSLQFFRALRHWRFPLAWSGLVVGIISIFQPLVWGNGDLALIRVLHGDVSPASILSIRILATMICVGAGTAGGVFTPTLFAGAAAGMLASQILPVSQPLLLGIVGLGALLAAVTHAPIMSAMMAVELTGQWHLLPLILLGNLLASRVALRFSPKSLYSIATPRPQIRIASVPRRARDKLEHVSS